MTQLLVPPSGRALPKLDGCGRISAGTSKPLHPLQGLFPGLWVLTPVFRGAWAFPHPRAGVILRNVERGASAVAECASPGEAVNWAG